MLEAQAETDTGDLKNLLSFCFHTVFSETIMFLHEIFHQGLKARIANWPTLVLGKLLLNLTQYTQIHTVCTRSAATQLHQGQVFSGPPHPVCLIQTSVLTSCCCSFPYLSLQQAHSLSLQTMTTQTRGHNTNAPPKTEAPSTDKHHLGDRLLKDTTANYL